MGRDDEYQLGMAFLLWLGTLFGVAGVHRFYLGKKWTGLIYLFTWGLFGIGSVVDLVLMRQLVDEANIKQEVLEARAARRALARGDVPHALPPARLEPGVASTARPSEEQLRLELTRAAAEKDGALSVTQGVLATGKSFAEVEAALDEMARSGYVGIDNDPDSGVVIYTFRELSS